MIHLLIFFLCLLGLGYWTYRGFKFLLKRPKKRNPNFLYDKYGEPVAEIIYNEDGTKRGAVPLGLKPLNVRRPED